MVSWPTRPQRCWYKVVVFAQAHRRAEVFAFELPAFAGQRLLEREAHPFFDRVAFHPGQNAEADHQLAAVGHDVVGLAAPDPSQVERDVGHLGKSPSSATLSVLSWLRNCASAPIARPIGSIAQWPRCG